MDTEQKLINEIAKSDNTELHNAFLKFQEEQIEKRMRFAETLENLIKKSNNKVFNDINTIQIFKAIASFMDWNTGNSINEITFLVPNLYPIQNSKNEGYTETNISDFEFNTNWNWLMPVIEKISTKKQTINPLDEIRPKSEDFASIQTFGQTNAEGMFMFRFNNYNLHCKQKLIDAVFDAVGEYLFVNGFIKE